MCVILRIDRSFLTSELHVLLVLLLLLDLAQLLLHLRHLRLLLRLPRTQSHLLLHLRRGIGRRGLGIDLRPVHERRPALSRAAARPEREEKRREKKGKKEETKPALGLCGLSGAQMTPPDGRLGTSKQQSKMRNTPTKKQQQQRKAFHVKSVSREKRFT